MSYKTSILLCTVLAASFAYAADDEVRVLVFPSGTKPSVAAQNPKFEVRKTSGKDDMAMMCDKCMKKVEKEGTKPAVKVSEEKCEAFLCSHCGHMVWRDKGKEQTFDEKDEKKALHTLEAELKKDPTTKPGAASNIGKS
jgi:hypothetical protein